MFMVPAAWQARLRLPYCHLPPLAATAAVNPAVVAACAPDAEVPAECSSGATTAAAGSAAELPGCSASGKSLAA